MTKASVYRRSRSSNPDVAFPALVRLGEALTVSPTTDTGYRAYGAGRLFLPAVTNVVPQPQATLTDHSFWPETTGHTAVTANLALPLPIADQPLLTTCLRFVNDGTADPVETHNLTLSASSDYMVSLYVYAPTVGGALTITTQETGASTVATIAAAGTGWTRYSVKHTTAGGETTLYLRFSFAGGTASTVYVTGAMLEKSAVLTPYFDGTYPDCAWTGAANASTSTRTVSTLTVPFAAPDAGATVAMRWAPLFTNGLAVDAYLVGMNGYSRLIMATSGNNPLALFIAGGTSSQVSAAAQAWSYGVSYSGVARWSDTKQDLTYDGTASAQVNRTGTATPGTAVNFGGSMAGFARPYYLGPVAICPSRISDAETVTLDAMLTAGATGLELFRFFQRGGYTNTLILPLAGDSVGYKVV